MRYATLGGGKRLRPFLAIEAARLFGGDGPGVLRAAASVELIHCYSLVHDDLPAMDDDELRRGRPTTHRAYDEATAILVGDSLLTLAFDILSDEHTDPDPAIRVALVSTLARAAGIGGMAGGQMLDLEAEGRFADDGKPLALGDTEILRLQAMKTGALLTASVEMGAIVGRADGAGRDALHTYGHLLGQAFQIADDLLDVVSDAATLGKATGKDFGERQGDARRPLGRRRRARAPRRPRRGGGEGARRFRREGGRASPRRALRRRPQELRGARDDLRPAWRDRGGGDADQRGFRARPRPLRRALPEAPRTGLRRAEHLRHDRRGDILHAWRSAWRS